MVENTLVYGGNSDLVSNRAVELASELEVVPEDIVESVTKRFDAAESLEEVALVLIDLVKENINLAGSREYVYMSERMLKLVETRTFFPFNLLTRSCGLRQAVMRIVTDG